MNSGLRKLSEYLYGVGSGIALVLGAEGMYSNALKQHVYNYIPVHSTKLPDFVMQNLYYASPTVGPTSAAITAGTFATVLFLTLFEGYLGGPEIYKRIKTGIKKLKTYF